MMSTAETLMTLARGMDFNAYAETARAAQDQLSARGIEVTIRSFPTGEAIETGKRVVPEAWTIRKATLTAVAGDGGSRLITDFAQDPFSVIGWSAASGDEAAGVRIADDEEALGRSCTSGIAGKIVLTRSHERSLWGGALDAGAQAVVVDSVVRGIPDAKRWIRFGWSGWPVWTKRRGPGFSLSVREGDALRARLAKDPGLRLAAHVEAERHEGALPAVDAFIRGESDEEVVLVAHLFEPGALDNAAGCATVIHIMRALAEAIEAGKLRRPRRSVRAILTFEVFGFDRYLRELPDIAGRWKALVCVDCAGPRYDTSKALPGIFLSVPGWPTVMDALAFTSWRGCVEGFGRSANCVLHERAYYTDDCIANRARGLAGVAFGAKTDLAAFEWFRGYHSSADNMDTVRGDGLEDCAAAAGATTYLAACASPESAGGFLGACEELARAEIEQTLARFAERVREERNPHTLEKEAARLGEMTRSRLATIGAFSGTERCPGRDEAFSRVEGEIAEQARLLREELGAKVGSVGRASAAAQADERMREEAERFFPVRRRAAIPYFDTISGHGDLRARLERDNNYTPLLDAADGEHSAWDLWTTSLLYAESPRSLAQVLEAFRLYAEIGAVKQ